MSGDLQMETTELPSIWGQNTHKCMLPRRFLSVCRHNILIPGHNLSVNTLRHKIRLP